MNLEEEKPLIFQEVNRYLKILKLRNTSTHYYFQIRRQMLEEVAKMVQNTHLCGVGVRRRERRVGPGIALVLFQI